MTCGEYKSNVNDKFVITKGMDNHYIFTIKKNSSTLAIEIQPSDTFVAYIRKLSDGSLVMTKPLTIDNALSGRTALIITAADTAQLESSRGGEEDRYYLRPTYSITLDCDTADNGAFLAKVAEVYVD